MPYVKTSRNFDIPCYINSRSFRVKDTKRILKNIYSFLSRDLLEWYFGVIWRFFERME